MEILCLFIPHLPVQWELSHGHDSGATPVISSRGQAPLIIGGFPHERKTVIDCSGRAAAAGVHPGMPLRQAHHRCPDAAFLPVDEGAYARAFEAVLEILDRFSPAIEVDSPGKAFLDITGSGLLFGPASVLARRLAGDVRRETGFQSRIGIAGGKFVAGIAASLAKSRLLVVPDGRERDFLGPLSVELLPIPGEAISWLKRLGLRTMGQVAGLPRNALASQMGGDGLTAQRLAAGIDRDPVRPRPRPQVLEQMLTLESPVDSLEALLAAIDRLLARLLPALHNRYQVCGQVKLSFRGDGGQPRIDVINLKTPLDSKAEIMGILQRHLQPIALPEGITEIGVGLARLGGEPGRQKPLSSAARGRQEEALERVEKDLECRFGHGSLKKVVEVDPDSRIPERRLALADSTPDD